MPKFLLSVEIRVHMPLFAGGYRVIDLDGKEHKLADHAELLAYYKKVMNK